MEIFNPEHHLLGRNLFVDLDVIITGDITPLWQHGDSNFTICQDFNRVFVPKYDKVNSSVMAWSDYSMEDMYLKFTTEQKALLATHRGDQDYIGEYVKKPVLWPTPWVRSYKWEVWRGGIKDRTPNTYMSEDHQSKIPPDCRIIAFHGKPKPHELSEKKLTKLWLT